MLARYHAGIVAVLRDVSIIKSEEHLANTSWFVALVALPFAVLVVGNWVWRVTVGRERAPLTHQEAEAQQSWSDRFNAIEDELKAASLALQHSVAAHKSVSPVAAAESAVSPVPTVAAVVPRSRSRSPKAAAPAVTPAASGKKKTSGSLRKTKTPKETPAASSAKRQGAAERDEALAATTPIIKAPLPPAPAASAKKPKEKEVEPLRPRAESPDVESRKPAPRKVVGKTPTIRRKDKELQLLLENQASLLAAPSPSPGGRRASLRTRK